MAKQKKKKHKKHYPRISKADKTLQGIIFAASFIFVIVFAIIRMHKMITYFLKPETALAYSTSFCILWWCPFILFVLIATGSILSYMEKHPIFGNKKVNYYDKDKYLFTLPLFDKRYSKEEIRRVRKLSKRQKRNIIIIASIGVVLYGLTFFGIYGRNMINTDSIERYNCVNELTASYSYDQVAECEIVSSPQTYGRNSSPPEIWINLTFNDGQIIYFYNDDFRQNFNSMAYVKDKLANTKISYDDKYLDEFLQYYNFTDEEEQTVKKLFER